MSAEEKRTRFQYVMVAMIPAIMYGIRLAGQFGQVTAEELADAVDIVFQRYRPARSVVEDKELEEITVSFCRAVGSALKQVKGRHAAKGMN